MLLITGITGHTGTYFLQELINNNYMGPIRCVIRSTSDTSLIDKSGLNIEKVKGDLNDSEFIESIMGNIDTVMHIYNIHHSPMIVKAAIKEKVKRVILVHTTGIYSQFKYASEEYKEIEKKINEYKNTSYCSTNITILRPSMIYGDLRDRNMSKFIKMIDKLRIMPVINGGNSLIQPVNAKDLGEAYYNVLISPEKTGGKIYDLSGDRPIRMIEVFRIINKELNKKTYFVSVPLSIGVIMARIIKTLTSGRIDYIERVQRMGENRNYPHDDAITDFGYNPLPFENGIRIEVQEYLTKRKKAR